MQPEMLIMLLRAQYRTSMRTNESHVTNGLANSLLYATPEIHEENVAKTSTPEVP